MTAPSVQRASPDAEAVRRLLRQISDQIQQQQPSRELVDDTVANLGNVADANFTMNKLAPSLFLESTGGDDGVLTSHEALSVLTLLVSTDADTYLIPASRAVRSVAEDLASSSSTNGPTVHVEVTDEVLAAIISQLSGDNVEVSANASVTISSLGRKLGPPLSDRAIRSISSTWRDSSSSGGRSGEERKRASTVSVRCASSVVDLVTQGDAAMESAISCGGTDLLLRMVADDTDPLVQMSALDLMERMANTVPMHGNRARWLFSREVLGELLRMAGGDEGGEPDPILGGTALRVVSSVCHLGQRDSSLFGLGGSELLTGFHRALHGFNASGELERLAYVDAVSSFASASPDAIALVLDDPVVRNREGWLSLAVAQPKLKSVILLSVSNVLDPPTEVDANGDTLQPWNTPSNQVSMRLFEMLGDVNNRDATELVLGLAKSPIVETRLGAYALLRAVAKRGTGAQVLLSHGGFFEFLVNRDIETTKEGKEAKFEIIKAVMESDARGLLADNIVRQLDTMLKQGPHFVQTQPWELMTEE